MSRVNAELARLFDGADADLYTLPPEIGALRKAIDRLSEPQPPAEAVGTVLDRVIGQTKQAAIAGTDLPDPTALLHAEQQQAIDLHRQRVIGDAREQLGERLVYTVSDLASTIITDHLRPVHDAVVAELSDSAKLTEQYEDNPRAALTAPARVRAALAGQPELYERYTAVIYARSTVLGCNAVPQRDVEQVLSGVRNAEQLWPRRARYGTACPWPDGLPGLLWQLRNGAELWLPTAAEQDARYEEVYGEAERQQQADASHLQAYGAMYR